MNQEKKKRAGRYSWLLPFLKIGCIGFGGGTSLIPVIEQEMVQKEEKITKEEYETAVIVSSITPGALPVEISSMLGKILGGTRGMLLAAVGMALPGALATLLLVSGMSVVNDNILDQIKLLSVGVSAFILAMLTMYITGTIQWAKEKKRIFLAVGIIGGVAVLNAGKSFCKLLSLAGISASPIVQVSAVKILLLTFLALIIRQYVLPGKKGKKKKRKAKTASSLQKNRFHNASVGIHSVVKEEAAWLLFWVLLSLPAILSCMDSLVFILKGYLSSIMSFGGGDAYLTIADSMFVSEDMITESQFYGQLVTVVNVLPGSILCKTLTGIGYYMGFNRGGVLLGYAVALAGFVTSIVGSCSVVSLAQYVFEKFENISVLRILKSWIKTIISGLLVSVMLSLVYQSLKNASVTNVGFPALVLELLILWIMDLGLIKSGKISNGWIVFLSGLLSLAIGNICL
ncbi:MAG: chromate transporter [Muricoprocola sp.]